MAKKAITPISFASLPAINAPLDGGTFAGVTTRADGTHCAVVRLPGFAENLTWAQAKAWAKKQGGELPTRPVAALLFVCLGHTFQKRWHWTADEFNASYAWRCYFALGFQLLFRKSYDGCAVAVRLIPIAA